MERLFYFFLFILGAVLSFVKFGIFAAKMDAAQFGCYSLVFSSYVYLIYLFSFGANEYVLKEASLSYWDKKKQHIRNQALWHGNISLLAFSTVIVISVNFIFSEKVTNALIFAVLLAFVMLSFNIIESFFRAKQQLVIFSAMSFGRASLIVFFSVYIENLNYQTALMIDMLSAVFIIFCVYFFVIRNEKNRRTRISLGCLKKIMQKGYFFSLSTMLKNLLFIVDKGLVGAILGSVLLGVYSFSMLIIQVALLSSALIMNILGPKILILFRDGFPFARLLNWVSLSTIVIIVVSALLYAPLRFGFEAVIMMWFDQYAAVLENNAFAYIYFSAVFMFCSLIIDWLFIAISKERAMLVMSLVSILSFLCFFSLFIRMDRSLESVYIAIVTTRVVVMSFQFLYLYGRRNLKKPV